MKRARIIGTGSYLPEKVMTNEDWSRLVDTNDEWITTRTGIKERHFAAEGEATSDLVAKAALRAVDDAGLEPTDIDTMIVATVTPDTAYPSTANWTQKKMGIPPIPSFDIGAGCTGFLYGLIVAQSMLLSGVSKRILVSGAEILSRMINWEDRNTCVLFGDGAGAAVLTAEEGESGMLSTFWGADGNLGDLLLQPAGGTAMPASEETVRLHKHTVHMAGNEVFKHAVLRMQESAMEALKGAGWTAEDVDLYIPHQANTRIIDATIRRAGIPQEKTVVTIDHIANVSAATIPLSLDEVRKNGRLKEGDNLLMTAFGAGLTWAGVTMRM